MSKKVYRGVVGCVLSLVVTIGTTSVFGQDSRLVDAAARQEAHIVRALLDDKVDVNAPRADGATALLWAAHWDDLDLASRLLRAGADVHAADDHGVTPLHRAAENASPAIVEMLVAAGADPNAFQTSGLTPLMTAARTGSVAVIEMLLAHGAHVNAATIETQSTALMWAVVEPHPDIVRTLLAAGADPHRSTTGGFTPLVFAAGNGDIEMATILIAAGVDVDETGVDGTHALPYAIVRGHDAFAAFLLEQGADPNGSIAGISALHAAAGNVGTWLGEWNRRQGGGRSRGQYNRMALDPLRRLALVKALLAQGADPNARITTSAMFMSYIGYPRKGAFEPFACGTGDLRGATPLWVAAFSANAPVQDIRGGVRTSFDEAEVRASTEILRVLLAADADPHLTTDDGTTPLMVAAGLGRSTYTPRIPRGPRSASAEEAVKALVEAGANLNAVNEADFTALHGAAFRGLNEVIEYLVQQGADIDARDFRGRTAYRMAQGSKQSFQFQSWPETAHRLKQLGANTRRGIPGTVQERLRDVQVATQP